MKLTVQEIATICEVLNIRSNRNCTIKDLRMLDSVVATLKSYIPLAPEMPKDQSDNEAMDAYKKEVESYHAYEVEVDMMPMMNDVIKIKFNNTNIFFDDLLTRTKVLALAAKLGI